MDYITSKVVIDGLVDKAMEEGYIREALDMVMNVADAIIEPDQFIKVETTSDMAEIIAYHDIEADELVKAFHAEMGNRKMDDFIKKSCP